MATTYRNAQYSSTFFPNCQLPCSSYTAQQIAAVPNLNLTCTRRRRLEGEDEFEGDGEEVRRLTSGDTDYAASVQSIYSSYTVGINVTLSALLKLQDFDQVLVDAWVDSGIEDAAMVLDKLVDDYQDIYATIAKTFNATLGPVLEFATTIIDKVRVSRGSQTWWQTPFSARALELKAQPLLLVAYRSSSTSAILGTTSRLTKTRMKPPP